MSSYSYINLAICRALGLDPSDVASITMSFTADDWPRVTVLRRLFDGKDVVDVLDDYELKPKEANTTD